MTGSASSAAARWSRPARWPTCATSPVRRSTPSWPRSPNGLAQLPGVHDLDVEGNRVRCEVDTAQLDAVMRQLSASGIKSLVAQPPTLEELFLRHYEDDDTSTEPVAAAR